MKRLFIVASLAIAAIGCQKTEIQNEVLTPIGFSTEIGKQTRAINNGSTVIDNYGVFSYLYNAGVKVNDPVMNNQEVGIDGKPVGATYYWPNDPDNHINFYAYSPFMSGQVVGMNQEGVLTLTNYSHTSYYTDEGIDPKQYAVDFMVADAVTGAKYTTKYGTGNEASTYGAGVPITFHHEMTQVSFNVVKTTDDEDVEFRLVSIAFNGAYQTVDFNSSETPKWSGTPLGTPLSAYPLTVAENAEDANIVPAANNEGKGLTTAALTMIPLTPASITVNYTIEANGAVENVVETMTLQEDQWAANKKITYTLSIGLHPISFKAEVASWTESEVDFVPDEPATPAAPANPTQGE